VKVKTLVIRTAFQSEVKSYVLRHQQVLAGGAAAAAPEGVRSQARQHPLTSTVVGAGNPVAVPGLAR
jgi:hypothetical protein